MRTETSPPPLRLRAGAALHDHPIATYVLRRLVRVLVAILLVSVIIFVLTEIVGDPVRLMLPMDVDASEYERLRSLLGYDRHPLVRYWEFLTGIFTGNWGDSSIFRRPALDVVASRLPITFILAGCALAIAIVVAIPLGFVAGMRPGGWADRIAVTFATGGQVVPGFLIGLLLIMALAVGTGWFPTGGHGTARHLVLPAVTLSAYSIAGMTRLMRSGMVEAMQQPFVAMAQAKGMTRTMAAASHAIRHAALPVLTLGGLQLGMLLNGAVIIETVFNIQGLGSTAVTAVTMRDVHLVQAIVLTGAVIYALTILIVDLLYLWLDPRIGYQSQKGKA